MMFFNRSRAAWICLNRRLYGRMGLLSNILLYGRFASRILHMPAVSRDLWQHPSQYTVVLSSSVYDNAYLRICQSLERMVPFHRSSNIHKIQCDNQKCSAFVSPRQTYPTGASFYSVLDYSNNVEMAWYHWIVQFEYSGEALIWYRPWNLQPS